MARKNNRLRTTSEGASRREHRQVADLGAPRHSMTDPQLRAISSTRTPVLPRIRRPLLAA